MSVVASSEERRDRRFGRRGSGLELAARPSVAVGALVLVAFVLRASQMDQSIFGDELWTYQQVAGHSLAGMFRAIRPPGENAPPLFFILAWASAKVGNPTIWIRLPSLVLGLATIPVVYALGRETLDRTAGLIGAAVLAASPFSLYYGIEARPYATLAFFVAASMLALVKATGRRDWRWWAVYVAAVAGAAYSGYTAIFPLVVEAAWALWVCRRRVWQPLLAYLAAAVLYLPWLGHVHAKGLGIIGFLEPFTLHNASVDLLRVIPGYPYAPVSVIPGTVGLVVVGLALLIGVTAIIRRQLVAPARPRAGVVLVVGVAASAPIGLALYSALSTSSIWDARDLYASVPAGALVVGAVLAAIPARIRGIAVAAVMATLVYGLVRAVGPSYSRPPFRDAAAYLDRAAAPRDPILLYPSFLGVDADVQAQLRRSHLVMTPGQARWPARLPGRRAFAVVERFDGDHLSALVPRAPGYHLVGSRAYTGLVSFVVFTFAKVG